MRRACARSRTALARPDTENASPAGRLRPCPGRSQPTTSNGNMAAHRPHSASADVPSEGPTMRTSAASEDPASRVAVSSATGHLPGFGVAVPYVFGRRDEHLRMQRAMNRAAFGDIQQPGALLVGELTVELLSRAQCGPAARRWVSQPAQSVAWIRRWRSRTVMWRSGQPLRSAYMRTVIGGAGGEAGQEQVIGRGAAVRAADGDRLVGGQLMAADRDALAVGAAGSDSVTTTASRSVRLSVSWDLSDGSGVPPFPSCGQTGQRLSLSGKQWRRRLPGMERSVGLPPARAGRLLSDRNLGAS